ncbi:MAG TPA: SDR family NAD(P)-dependent oxidoreductase, partial [Thermoanaerobaculia bacterium]|nr:SDR family NAD(P)-dependent oxidoreductase [Thermoanaerobaculia bacterium]
LAAALAGPGGPPRRVLHAWLLEGRAGGETGAAPSVEAFEAAQRLGFHALVHLLRVLDPLLGSTGDPDRGLDLTVLADRLLAVTGEEPLAPEKAPLLALCRVLPQERAGAAARAVDVALPPSDEARGPAELEALADRVVAEALAGGGDREVALRRGERWVPAFEGVRVGGGRPAPFRREGVYLVTGGLAGNGLALARWLAREHAARLALVEGPELPADAAQRAAELEALGGRVLTLPLGAAWGDEAAWSRVLARTEERFGALHGAIHAAGASGERAFRTLAEVGEEESAWHFGPKVHAALALDAALDRMGGDRPLDFRVLLSSLASVLGGVAYGPYAAANRFLDAFAAARARGGGAPWLALGWDLWRFETGEDAITGVRSDLAELEMAPREGEEAFGRAVAVAGAPGLGGRLLVSTADLPRRIARQDARAGERRGGLRAPAARHPRPDLGVPYEAPAGELEERIAAVWGRALGFEEVGVLDNFFDLGGDSFVAIQVASELRDALGVDLPAAKLYQGLTVRSLAALLATDEGASAAARAGELEERRAAMGRRRDFLERRRARRVAEVADE